jgi:hypothetical protein
MSPRSASILDVLSDPSQLHNFAEGYNKKIDEVPRILTHLLGDERINIKITLNDGNTCRLCYKTKNGRITTIDEGWLRDPTIIVTTTQKVIEKINASGDPLTAFKRERASLGLIIEGQSLKTRIKLEAALSSDSVLWFFYYTLFG